MNANRQTATTFAKAAIATVFINLIFMTNAAELDQAKNYLDTLDLSYLADAMSSASYPMPRWQRETALQSLQRYKNFLWLHKLHPKVSLVPTKEIDECWHNHILYTRDYA